MAIGIIGRKAGMTRVFTEAGQSIPVTVIEAAPNRVTQVKTEESDGYRALQVTTGSKRANLVNKPAAGHYAKAGMNGHKHLVEVRVDDPTQYEVGQEIKADVFSEGQRVDVIGTSKGRGTTGVVKRHGFAIKRRTHGTHEFFRHGGSIGTRLTPGHVLKGKRMPGHMGAEQVTVQNLKVARVDAERNLVMVRGGVPGPKGALVTIRKAVKA